MHFALFSDHYRYAFCVLFRSLQAYILLCFPVITGKQVCVMFRSLEVLILCYVPVIIGMHFVLCSGHYRHAFYVVLRLVQAYIMCWAPVVTVIHSVLFCG